VKSPAVPVEDLGDVELAARLAAEGLRLTPGEARRVRDMLGHDPSRVEAVLFDTLWSEHCSYKSSRALLKTLPTRAPHVVLGPGEDAGVVYFTTHAGERWDLVVAHESHNHPSQVVPREGAATGIGGVVRDVYCMGADVVGVLDGLRFGALEGPHGERSREIALGVVDGIWQYANPLGVPNLGGDTVFDHGFDDNCLVNVVAVGIVRERDVIRSRVPVEAKETPYVFVLVGKPTDASGFGGASFASAVLDEEEQESNKGAVQIPDPFLKRMLTEATKKVLELARTEGIAIGFKDLGAGGIACATSELAAAAGMGADVELSAVALDGGPFPPEVIACSETQERYCLVVPQDLAPRVQHIYNVDFELPRLYPGARAQVIGTVRAQDTVYRLTHEGDLVGHTTTEAITEGIRYERASGPDPAPAPEPNPPEPGDLGEILAALLTGPGLASREAIFRHYDTEVQGHAVLRPGEADATLIVPVEGCAAGLACTVDGNPFVGALDPYQGGASAVAEAMRNVAAIGATPWCLTDCLNYGNPEDPAVFRTFREGVRGLADAAREIGLPGEAGIPVPYVSGNVSFYNQSVTGKAVPPSPIVACFGVIEDYTQAVTLDLKDEDDVLVLLGARSLELGASAYWRRLGVAGGRAPQVSFEDTRREIAVVLDGIAKGWIRACHDISEGGLGAAAAEMALPSRLGVDLELDGVLPDGRADAALFGERGGFLVEVSEDHVEALLARAEAERAAAAVVGRVRRERSLRVRAGGETRADLDLAALAARWRSALGEGME